MLMFAKEDVLVYFLFAHSMTKNTVERRGFISVCIITGAVEPAILDRGLETLRKQRPLGSAAHPSQLAQPASYRTQWTRPSSAKKMLPTLSWCHKPLILTFGRQAGGLL